MDIFNGSPIRFGLKWTVATTIGYLIGFITLIIMMPYVNEEYGELYKFTYGINYLLISGIGIGILQGLVLRKSLSMKWWILASIVGWMLAILSTKAALLQNIELNIINWFGREVLQVLRGAILWLKDIEENIIVLYLIEAGMIGLIVGFLQSLLIRKVFTRAYWWIIVNLLGWGISSLFLAVNELRNEMMNNFIYSGVYFLVVLSWLPGFLVGVITAIGLIWIMTGPMIIKVPKEPEIAATKSI